MMMNTIQAQKIAMADLERVNGGGWFDNIVDFVLMRLKMLRTLYLMNLSLQNLW